MGSGGFKKGSIPWNKGKICPQLSEKQRGSKNHMYGRTQTTEHRRAISEALKKRISEGRFFSEEHRRRISQSLSGRKIGTAWNKGLRCPQWSKEKHWAWRGGIKLDKDRRKSYEGELWREAVFKRDNWTCRMCGVRGGRLEAHHIKGYKQFPELRFEVSNGATLCHECHMTTPNYGWKGAKLLACQLPGGLKVHNQS